MLSAARWSQTLRGRLTLTLFGLGVLPIAILTGYFVVGSQEELAYEDQLQTRTTERLAERIESYVEMHRRGIESAARQATLRKLPLTEGSRDLEAILISLHEQFPGFINLYFATADARTVSFYPSTSLDGQSMVGRDFSDRWHFARLKADPKTHISPVMRGVGGTDKLLVTITAPLFDDDNAFRGFVLGALDLAKIQTFVASEALPSGSYAVVTDREGHAVASPSWKDKEEPSRILSEPLLDAGREQPSGTSEHVSSLTGRRVHTTFVRLDSPDWFVWISRTDVARTAGLRHTLTAGAAGILLLLIGVFVISTLFARSIALRLEVLAERMRRFASGETPDESPITAPTRFRAEELETVTEGFERMARTVSRASAALRERNALLEHGVRARTAALVGTFESMEEAFALVGETGEVLFLNTKLRALVGITDSSPVSNAPQATSENWGWILLKLQEAGFDTSGTSTLELDNLKDARLRFTILQAGEKARWWQVSTFPVRPDWDDEPGRSGASSGNPQTAALTGFDRVFLLRDVTARREMEELKNSLISVVAHEMKTPVAALRMEVDTLKRPGADWSPEFVEEILNDMDDDTKRLEHLVTDWLDLSRIEAGALRLRFERVPIPSVIREAADEVLRRSPEGTVISCPDALERVGRGPFIDADRRRLRQAFVNLFSNAVRYCDRTPEIAVTVRADEAAPGRLVVEIRDNGIGIAPSEFERIFEKFHQTDMSTTRRQGGTGLGLPIVRGILTAHGGTVAVEKSSPEGTTFRLTLPQAARPE